MGKRELVLIAAFVLLGAVVYQVTAPPAAPGSTGFSARRVIDAMRRGVRGQHAEAQTTSTRVEPIEGTVEEIRFKVDASDVTVTGDDRSDVEVTMTVWSNGFDTDEATRWAKAAVLKLDHAGPTLIVSVDYPKEGTQHSALVVKVPERLRARFDSGSGPVDASQVAGVELGGSMGTVKIAHVTGNVNVTHRGGQLTIDGCRALKLNARGTRATISRVTGDVAGSALGSTLHFSSVAGSVDLDTRSTDLTFDDPRDLKEPIRIDAYQGSVRIDGLRVEARVDGHGTRVWIALAAAVPLTVETTNGPITITPPAAGYTLDAVTTDGRLTPEAGTLQAATDQNERRANGPVRGGGPAISLRDAHGDIDIRAPKAEVDGPKLKK